MTGGGCSDGPLIGKWQHPPSFYCPISQQCMHDPVVLCDGHTYERRHIERWLRRHHTSPVSGLKLPQRDIFPNHALRNAIEEYFQQVFSAHRRAIRKTMGRPAGSEPACSSACLARRVDALMQCALLMSADLSTECVLRQIMDEARTLLGAEVASVFLYDAGSQELFSTVNSTGGELRIPVGCGVAGHVARTGEPLVIQDAYSDSRFDRTVDSKTGFRTRNMICVPLKAKKGRTLGVAQLLNKSAEDGSEPSSFSPEDLHLLQVFASQAATALASDGAFEMVAQAAPADAAEAATSVDAAAAAAGDGPDIVRSLTDELTGASCALRLSRNLPEELLADASDATEYPGSASQPASLSPSSEGCRSDAGAALKDSLGAPSEASAEPHAELDEAAVADLLQQAFDGWNFDALGLARLTGNRPLSSLAVHLFEMHGLIRDLGLCREKVANFFSEVEKGYDDGGSVAYHNRAHAASVLHVMHALLQHGGVLAATAPALALGRGGGGAAGDAAGDAAGCNGGQLERMACLLAAAVHDYDHRGLNNDFLAKTGDERAVRYNDRHVNEQHHAAAAFSLLLRPENNFLAHLPASDFRRLRSLVIDLVIGTDMAEGSRILQSFVGKLGARPAGEEEPAEAFAPSSAEDALLFLQVAMKCADLGHLSLDWGKHCQWVQLLEKEFFAQGDLEKEAGLPVSFLMDRSKPGASATQVGFFEFVALPLFQALVRAAPAAEPLRAGAAANYGRWKEPGTAGAGPQ